jgi:hypothetical protein
MKNLTVIVLCGVILTPVFAQTNPIKLYQDALDIHKFQGCRDFSGSAPPLVASITRLSDTGNFSVSVANNDPWPGVKICVTVRNYTPGDPPGAQNLKVAEVIVRDSSQSPPQEVLRCDVVLDTGYYARARTGTTGGDAGGEIWWYDWPTYADGSYVPMEISTVDVAPPYEFVGWAGDPVDRGYVQNPTSTAPLMVTAYYHIDVGKQFFVEALFGVPTAPGDTVVTLPYTPVTVEFSEVVAAGHTMLDRDMLSGPSVPSAFRLGTPPRYYDVTTTATYSGSITVCIDYSGMTFTGSTELLRLLHYEGGQWVDCTTSVDTVAQVICGSVDSLSPFVVVEPVSIPVYFADANLKAAVEAALGKTDPTPTDMLTLTSLSATACGISDLTGIEYATNVTSLSFLHNQITNLSPLSTLTKLSSLDLNENQISDLSPLSGLTNLAGLELGWNLISNLSPLSGLTNLSLLNLVDNGLSDISPLSSLADLEYLYLFNNQISDISALSAFTGLGALTLLGNPLDAAAYRIHIPQIVANNPGILLTYDPPTWRTLTLSAGPGGQVTDPGEGSFSYINGEDATIQATAEPGYHFSGWSGNFCSERNPVLLTMDQDYTIQADFGIDQNTLTIATTIGGSVLTPGEGQFDVAAGTVLTVEAVPSDARYEFSRWSGTAVDGHKVQDPNAPQTTVTADGDYTLEAIFTERTEGPVLGFSLGELTSDDPQQFDCRITNNNTARAILVERVTGAMPDPNGMMQMQMINEQPARAKVRFGKCQARTVIVRFQYLFQSPAASEIVVYLSDVPDLLGYDDPLRTEHYLEVGRVPVPPDFRPRDAPAQSEVGGSGPLKYLWRSVRWTCRRVVGSSWNWSGPGGTFRHSTCPVV